MKHYCYYPGCCACRGTGKAFNISALAVSDALEMELTLLEDWNCCGSTPGSSTDELEAILIATRNLALAEKTGLDLVTPCSDCYTTFNKTNLELREYPDVKARVDECLAVGGLKYKGNVRVRHLFEVAYTDVGLEFIRSKVVNPLHELKVAPYYGCQMIRPECDFDEVENPQSLDKLITSLGAESVPFPLKDRCCGGSLMIPELDLALGLAHKLLESATSNGAQCIVTVCPLCQTNLDAYQGMVNRKFKTKYNLPVLFFTQLIGLALGIEPEALALDMAIVSAEAVLSPYTRVAEPAIQTGGR